MNKEIWKEIQEYEGFYEISSFGSVRSLDRFCKSKNGGLSKRKGKPLTLSKEKDGYFVVGLSKYGKLKTYKVHRLVAIAFLKNDENKEQVNHKDGNKENNNLYNLEWCTMSENMKHAVANGLNNVFINKRKKVECIETKQVFDSITDCSNIMKIDDNAIINSCRNGNKTTKGFTFKYMNQ